MKDGTFRAVPLKGGVTFGAAPKLLVSDDGRLGPPVHQADQSMIDSIVMGALTDQNDTRQKGANASDVRAFGLPAVLHPVLATPFVELRLETAGAASAKPIEEALRCAGSRGRRGAARRRAASPSWTG